MLLSAPRRQWWPPLLAFLLQRALIATVAYASRSDPFASAAWRHWDSNIYLDIAANGYSAPHHCTPESHYLATDWCGNTAWFPGYPWAIRGVAAIAGADLAAVGVWISAIAQLAFLVLIWRLLDGTQHWPAMGLAAFFPGNIYMAAVFPVSLFVVLALACFHCCWSGRSALAAIAGAAAATCHPTGVLVGLVVVLWAVLHRRLSAAWVAAGPLAGSMAVFLAMRHDSGVWDAFSRVQARYGYSGNPLDTLAARLKPLFNQRYRDAKGFVTALQTLLNTIWLGSLAWTGFRRRWSDRESLIGIYVLVFWIVPLIAGGRLSLYRSEALLAPSALLAPMLPRRLQLALLAAATILSIPMASLFFRNVLV